MLTHPFFSKILMHSDQEIAETLGVGIKARKTIRQWPLSCVQEIQLNDGTKLIYKSQLPPTVEACFYQHASSSLLPAHRYLGRFHNCDIMIIEWINAPLLSDKICGDDDIVEYGKQIVGQIGNIVGELPVYINIGSPEAWLNIGQMILEKVFKLVSDGRFSLMSVNVIEDMRTWIESDKIIKAVTDNSRVIHGDLKADQVFITEDGYRVIDWQRPIIAPPEVDLVSLLVERKIDPLNYVDSVTIGIFWFLRLYWAVEAQFNLFPDSKVPVFEQWALEAINNILSIYR